MKIALLTFHNLLDLDLSKYFSNLAVELFIYTSTVNDNKVSKSLLPACCKGVSFYKNYMNNGAITLDILEENENKPFTHVLYLGEDDVLRVTRLAHKLGLPSLSLEAAMAYRDKFKMKSYLAESSQVCLPKFTAIESELDLIEFAKAVGFPVFVKPRTSSGSMFAKKIADQEQLRSFLEVSISSRLQDCEYTSDLIAEEYVDGKMYHVDGFIDHNGNIACLYPSKYVSDNLQLDEISDDHTLVSIMLDSHDKLYEKLISQTSSVVASLPDVVNVPIHAEFFVTDKNELIFCEIACRTGGAGVNQTIFQATGNDLNNLYILNQLGITQSVTNNTSKIGGWSLINPSNYKLPQVPNRSDFDFLDEIHFYYQAGTSVTTKAFSGDKVAKAIATGSTSNDVQQKLSSALTLFMDKSQAHTI